MIFWISYTRATVRPSIVRGEHAANKCNHHQTMLAIIA